MQKYKKPNIYVKILNFLCLFGSLMGWVTDWIVTDRGVISVYSKKDVWVKPANKKQKFWLQFIYWAPIPRFLRPFKFRRMPKMFLKGKWQIKGYDEL